MIFDENERAVDPENEALQVQKDQLIDRHLAFLKSRNDAANVDIVRELNVIYLKLNGHFPDPVLEKEFIDETSAKINQVIDDLNEQAEISFHTEIPVLFKDKHRALPLTSIWI